MEPEVPAATSTPAAKAPLESVTSPERLNVLATAGGTSSMTSATRTAANAQPARRHETDIFTRSPALAPSDHPTISSGNDREDLGALAGHHPVGVVDGLDAFDRGQHRLEV